jgi:hypothetical protein
MDDARRALRPYERVIAFFAGLMLIGLVIQAAHATSGESWFFGFGDSHVCVGATPSQVGNDSGRLHTTGLAEGVRVTATDVDACTSSPTVRERLLFSLDNGMVPLFAVGVLLLIWWTLRRARRDGVFIESFARRVSRLGLYVLLGALAVNVVRTWAEWQLLKALIPSGSHPGAWHFSFTPLVVGLGLITVGRLMATTVPMREELDATI